MSLGWQYGEIKTEVAENPSTIQEFHTLLRGKQPHFLQAKFSHDPCITLDNFQFINSVNLPILSYFQRQKSCLLIISSTIFFSRLIAAKAVAIFIKGKIIC